MIEQPQQPTDFPRPPDIIDTPPPDIKARFPHIVPELPQGFERPVQGRLPLVRIGWALMMRREDFRRQPAAA